MNNSAPIDPTTPKMTIRMWRAGLSTAEKTAITNRVNTGQSGTWYPSGDQTTNQRPWSRIYYNYWDNWNNIYTTYAKMIDATATTGPAIAPEVA